MTPRPEQRAGSTRADRAIRDRVYLRDHGTCRWCGTHTHHRKQCTDQRRGCNDCYYVDHLVHWRDAPHLRQVISNLVVACRWCNLSRGVGMHPKPKPWLRTNTQHAERCTTTPAAPMTGVARAW